MRRHPVLLEAVFLLQVKSRVLFRGKMKPANIRYLAHTTWAHQSLSGLTMKAASGRRAESGAEIL